MITCLRRLVALALRRFAAFVDAPAPVLELAIAAPSETAIALAAAQRAGDLIVLSAQLRSVLFRYAPPAEIAQA
jgi:hypothetical protein